ncbi:MAG: hypothetical protein IJT49_00840 [Clostridia bacterium]|nr:hypothetical protein [Clostridia bacterium]
MKKIISLLIAAVMVCAVCISSAITVAVLAGDTDGDGEVNNKDVVTLFRYVSGDTKDEYESIYDFNGDKEINNKDVVELFRFVSSGKAAEEITDAETDIATEPETDTETVTETSSEETTGTESGEVTETETDTETETEESSVEITDTESEEVTETETEPEETFEPFVVNEDPTAELSIPRVIADHMVIQRDREIKVWGTSNKEGAKIRGIFMGSEARGEVKDGKWEIVFPAKKATVDPQTLTVDDSCGNTLTFKDILVGDVWIIGGQSNAEATSQDIPARIKDKRAAPLRIFHQGALYVINNRDLAKEPCEDIINPDWMWRTATGKNASLFSLLGWFFGCKLVDETEYSIPIGVVSIAASGSAMSELMPKNLTDKFGYTAGSGVGVNEFYNALTHPFLNMKFTGMIFFQGESESFYGTQSTFHYGARPDDYARDFEALMTELRSRWGFDFPIYNVQLTDYTAQSVDPNAQYGYTPYVGIVRTQQYNAYKNMKAVRLISSYDLGADEGYGNYLHSPYKQELAERIADLVLAEMYNIGDLKKAQIPEPEEITVVSSESSKMVINVKFKNVGDGLKTTNGSDTFAGFSYGRSSVPSAITDVEGKIISEDTVQITVERNKVSTFCKYIGYACQAHIAKDTVKIVNSYGMPVLAFYLPVK